MSHIHLIRTAAGLLEPWHSQRLGRVGSAQLKVLRMDERVYADEVHDFDEALIVLEGQMQLEIDGQIRTVRAGELYLVPAGVPHAVAPGSHGTLMIIDQ